MKRTSIIPFFLFAFVFTGICFPNTYMKRDRGRGLYHNEGANTVGAGNVWVSARALGFIWDDKFDSLSGVSKPAVHGFIESRVDAGVLDFISIPLQSRIISYPWDGKLQFGNVQTGIKVTYPNNKDLRLFGLGAQVLYKHSFLKNFNSIAGYRKDGTGFSPEGVIIEGGSVEGKILLDIDLISYNSNLPIHVMLNAGMSIPLDESNRDLSLYLFSAGASYSSFKFEGFVEYSIEALVNSVFSPKVVSKRWWSSEKRWEVALIENPMYLTLGGRYYASNGITSTVCAPLLLSSNFGTAMTQKDKSDLHHNPQLSPNRVRDTFDPWYAKWKIIVQIAFPIRYKHTAAQMRRNFLLLKNRKERDGIDIDEKLRETGGDIDSTQQNEESFDQDSRERLEKIRERRKQLKKIE